MAVPESNCCSYLFELLFNGHVRSVPRGTRHLYPLTDLDGTAADRSGSAVPQPVLWTGCHEEMLLQGHDCRETGCAVSSEYPLFGQRELRRRGVLLGSQCLGCSSRKSGHSFQEGEPC